MPDVGIELMTHGLESHQTDSTPQRWTQTTNLSCHDSSPTDLGRAPRLSAMFVPPPLGRGRPQTSGTPVSPGQPSPGAGSQSLPPSPFPFNQNTRKGLCKEKQIPKIRVYYGSWWVGPGLTRKFCFWKFIPK